ncbi:MAG: hypothetical protein OEV55_09095 [candidate division Zixibacteria bacterium]|nr:hypothetical protein [candidate division Zixibacteria bacterium]
MKRSVLYILCSLVTTLLVASCCPKNPAPNSVKTAHGNTDWHIDTAEEFLTGNDINGNPSASNHCPDTWTKTHMHVGLTNTNTYYYDKGVTAAGQDNLSTNGIDKPMLFFYAGHGAPTLFNTLGNSAYLTNMRLGNCQGSNDGTLRYYWQCSCEVFAHGPKTCTGIPYDYACPGDFDGSPDSDNMRNVYERWGPILNPALRMACGSSTLAYCHEGETNKIWDNYNNKGYDVADAFIDGLHRYTWNTPLCITTGGLFVSGTPLFDNTFTNAPNPSGSYYHIQYLSNFATTAPSIFEVIIPEFLPIYELIPLPLPDPLRKYKFVEKDDWMYSTDEIKGRGPAIKVNRISGAVYLLGEQRFDEKAKPLEEKEYISLAERFIENQGLTEKDISKPAGTRMVIQRISREEKQPDIQKFQKNVTLTFKRQITLDSKTVPFVGEGGLISIQLNNDGTLFNASKVWRQIKEISRTTRAKTYEQAYNEALAQIKERDAYKLADWTWGYEEQAGNVRQTELKAVFIFNFLPVDPEKIIDYPPRIIKISAHIE